MSNQLIEQIANEIELAVHKAIVAMTSGYPVALYRGDIKSALLKFATEVKRSAIEP